MDHCRVLLALGQLTALLLANAGLAGAQDCSSIPNCSSCTFRRVGTSTRMFCTFCSAGYVVTSDQRTCVCAPGFYWNADASACQLCGIGAWCPGGTGSSNRGPRYTCGASMTTATTRARYDTQCLTVPGTGLLGDSTNAQACSAGFYSYGLARKPCTRCPGSFTTDGAGADSKWKCACPPGYRYISDGAVPCGFGFYKSGIDFSIACTRCGLGLTTPSTTAGSAEECRLARPGYKLLKSGDAVTGATACGAGYYSGGGDVTECTQCPVGTTTAITTAASLLQCVAAPGYGYNLVSGGAFVCPIGTFKDYIGTAACAQCGEGLLTPAEGATSYATDCYIPEGWGASIVSYSPITLSAVKCKSGRYGVASRVFGPGSSQYACHKCPLYTTTPDTNPLLSPTDADTVVNNGSASCVTQPGYGWQSGAVVRCTAGNYSPGYTLAACTSCPGNMTTADTNPSLSAEAQAAVVNDAASDCQTLPGYGYDSGSDSAVRCTAGNYSPGYARVACTSCPGNMTTADTNPSLSAEAQAAVVNDAASDCQTLPGYGYDSGSDSAAQCPENTYAPGYTRNGCTACPGGTTSPAGSTSEAACVT